MTIGELLLAEIRRRGTTQTEAAREMGVQASAVSRWVTETGGPPTVDNCRKIAQYVGLPLADIMLLAGHIPDDAMEHGPVTGDPEWIGVEQELRSILEPVEKEYWPPIIQALRNLVQGIVPLRVGPKNVTTMTAASSYDRRRGARTGKQRAIYTVHSSSIMGDARANVNDIVPKQRKAA